MFASSNSRVFSVLPIILHSSRGSRKGTILVALGWLLCAQPSNCLCLNIQLLIEISDIPQSNG
jgi:hypothetical protein